MTSLRKYWFRCDKHIKSGCDTFHAIEYKDFLQYNDGTMKKLFLAISILIIALLAACAQEVYQQPAQNEVSLSMDNQTEQSAAHQAPPRSITIRSVDELTEMREIVEADDQKITDYLWRTQYIANGLESREDIIDFLELIDTIQIPYIKDSMFRALTHYPESNSLTVDMFFETELGERTSFRFFLNGSSDGNIAQESVRNTTGREAELVFQSADGRIQVFTPSGESLDISKDFIPMNIDGCYVVFGLRNNNETSSATLEQLFDDAVIITLKDIA